MSDYQTIRYQRDGDVGTLTLARPGKRNAQNPLMWEELTRLGAELGPDETLRCLVVTGEGPTFSAGIDLAEGMAGMLAGLAERPDDENARAAGRAAAGTFSWIPGLGCASAATPTARACSWPWRVISASSRKTPRSACWRPATGSCPTWAPPSGCPGSSVKAGPGS
jgi:hypothetical protein